MLIPILDEFKLTKKRFGQIIIGVGTLDDVIEVFTIILLCAVIGMTATKYLTMIGSLITLLIFFSLSFFLSKFKKVRILRVPSLGASFLFVIFLLFLFIGIGAYAESEALGAILAGIATKKFLSRKKMKRLKNK